MSVEQNGPDFDALAAQPVKIQVRPSTLIPDHAPYTRGDFRPAHIFRKPAGLKRSIPVALVIALLMLPYFSLDTNPFLNRAAAVEAPSVFVNTNGEIKAKQLEYGPEELMTEPVFFTEVKDSFLSEKISFIEADLSKMEIRYHQDGEVVYEKPILSKGKEGSWWETPAGLYQVESKSDNHFSSFGQVYTPWNMVFQGNFFIHGWPVYPDGSPVARGYSGGCIRLDTNDAALLYGLILSGTPVLVYESDFLADNFLYEPKAPTLTTDHYLVTDINNNTILAGDNLEEVLPIASLTKLMTALVAAEYINLDKSVVISSEKYVDSLVPRLSGRRQASMYSLLQLLLVESSNEAAEVIASIIGRDNFINRMNQKAAALGLVDTTFTDPSGLDDGNQSTVIDLMRLLQYIHNNRSFILELTKDAELDSAYVSGEFGELNNFNGMDKVANFIGGKVGETLAAGQTSATLHTISVDGRERVISIILLNSKDRTDDVINLHKYVEDRYGD